MSIDIDMLQRHNLYRFSCKVRVTPDDGGQGPTYLVKTEPVHNASVVVSMLDKIGELIEDGATEATVTVHGDGSLQCGGFKPGTNLALLALIGPGRDRYFNRLELMFDENSLNEAVGVHASQIVFGKPPSPSSARSRPSAPSMTQQSC